MKNIFTFLFLFTITAVASAQVGTIQGTIKDGKTQETVIGATVRVESLEAGALTDIDGNFVITKVPVGLYNVVITYIGYQTKTIERVRVEADKITVINTEMLEDAKMLEGVVIKSQKVTESEVSVVSEVKNLGQVASGISGQLIQKTQDRDAAAVVRRIPGVSIFDDRFVVVRGLSERYNTVLLNDIITPSTEVDSKSFSFDLIPSQGIDRLLVFKSASSDLPGDISGGAIKIYTKSIPSDNSLSASLTLCVRPGTTGKELLSYQGSPTDWLGFDNGSRALPNSFPGRNTIAAYAGTQGIIDKFKQLPDYYNVKQLTVLPDLRLNVNYAHRWFFGSKELNNISYINYSRTSQHVNLDQNRFLFTGETYRQFTDNTLNENVRAGLMSNWTLIVNPRTKFEFRNLFNQMGIKETVNRSGVDESNFIDFQGGSFRYEQRSIYSGQLSGTHEVNESTRVKWVGGVGYTARREPDYRRFIRSRAMGTEQPFIMSLPQQESPTLEQAARSYSTLNEGIYTLRVDVQKKWGKNENDDFNPKLSLGAYVEYKDRNFNNNWFGITNPNQLNSDNPILQENPEQFFQNGNLAPNKLYYGVGTNPEDKYHATNSYNALYAQLYYPIGEHVRLTAGLRGEYNIQKMDSRQRGSGAPISVNNPVFSPLPSLNVSYVFNKKHLVRFGYGATINRPEFRELAPFTYYDFVYDVTRTGYIPKFTGDKLKNGNVQNFDLRYEFYPTEGEFITVGIFDKEFNNPIENAVNHNGSNISFTVTNAAKAYSRGAEIEVRKSLRGLGSKFLNNLTFIFNGAYITSNVRTGTGSYLLNRSLQGQSPYVINTGFFYSSTDSGWQANILYNVVGKRIFLIGDEQVSPNIYEMPRNVIDLNVTKVISKRVELKLTIQDLLNQPFRLIQDTNRDNKITASDGTYQRFKRGNYFSIGAVFKM